MFGRGPGRWQFGLGLSMVTVAVLGCAGDAQPEGLSVEQAALGAAGSGSGGGGTCRPRDTADTTCDAVDDDCDGRLDEDCDFGPLQCPAGTRVLAGTRGDDMLVGTQGRDCILGYGGNDVLFGLGGDDVIVGGPGDDVL